MELVQDSGRILAEMLTLLILGSGGVEKSWKRVKNIERGIKWSSSKSPSVQVQVLHQHVRADGGEV